MTEELQTGPVWHRTASVVWLTIDVLGLLWLLYCVTIVAGKFRQVFDDLLEGRALPALTRAVLSVPPIVSIVFSLGAIAALIYKEVRIGSKTQTLVINATVFAVAVFLFLVLVVALFQPLTVGHRGRICN